MQGIERRPVFISLVGTAAATDCLYEKLEADLPKAFPLRESRFLGHPFGDYSHMQIGNKRKREYCAAARTCFRWGLFYDYNATVVQPAFQDGAEIIVMRRFGFDLYAGATAHKDCEHSLDMHLALVPYGVNKLGLCPPLYVFTEELDDRTHTLMHRYFDVHPGQRYKNVEPSLSLDDKVIALVCIVQNELERLRLVVAA